MGQATSDFTPLTDPQLYDYVAIAGKASPGLAVVNDVKRQTEWDVKKGKGTVGATITLVTRPPIEFSITFYIYTQDQFKQWAEFRKVFEVDPTKSKVTALSIFHPILDDLGVTSVVCKSISGLQNKGKAMYAYEVELLEYFPPPKKAATGTPDGSKANGGKSATGTPPDPIADAQQKEIADLLKQAQGPSGTQDAFRQQQ